MDKERYIRDYLMKNFGYTIEQASAITGGLIQESTLNTKAINPDDGQDGSDSIGIGQWNGPRANDLRDFAAGKGTDINDLDTQLDFINWEMTESKDGAQIRAGRELRNAKTVDEAAKAFIGYERPAGFSWDNPTAGHGFDNRLSHAYRVAGIDPNLTAASPPPSNDIIVGLVGSDPSLTGSAGADLLGQYAIGGATRPDTFSGMDQGFSSSLNAMFAAAPPEIQKVLRVTSGYRSPERQAQIISENAGKYGIDRGAWEADVAAMGPVAAGQKWAPQFRSSGMSAFIGKPGGSKHQHGTAADLKYLDPAAKAWAHANAEKFGLHFPLGNEDWHIEPIGSRGGASHSHGSEGRTGSPAPMPFAGQDQAAEGVQAALAGLLGPRDTTSGGAGVMALFGNPGDDTLDDAPFNLAPADEEDDNVAWDFIPADEAQKGGLLDAPPLDPATISASPSARSTGTPALDPRLRVPNRVRAEVGNLETQEDKLATLRKFYPDAQPYYKTNEDTGELETDGNFIMRDPETGSAMLYNPEGLDIGDWFSLAPEAGEMVGGIVGGIGGGALGAAGGSAVPALGTVAGGVSGAMAGAGTGATAGREAVQSGLNWLWGNEDTRTLPERATDAAITFGVNTLGEGIGQGVAAGAKAIVRGRTGVEKLSGEALDRGRQVVEDFDALGIQPTPGIVGQDSKLASREMVLAERGKRPFQERIDGAYNAINEGVPALAERMNGGNAPLRTKTQLGEALTAQADEITAQSRARGTDLHTQASAAAAGVPASGNETRALLAQLEAERAAMGAAASRTRGPMLDDVIEHTRDIISDIDAGVGYDILKQARTDVGTIRYDKTIDQRQTNIYDRLYESLSRDLSDTAAAAGPDALQAHTKANNFTRRALNDDSPTNVRNALAPIVGAKADENVLDLVLKGSKDGASRLSAFRRQTIKANGREAWDQFGSSVVLRLGYKTEAVDEVFDPHLWVKGWRSMSDAAKDTIFSGSRNAGLRQDLDRLARVTENLKNYKKADNHSGTAKWGIADMKVALPFGGAGLGTIGAFVGGTGSIGTAMVSAAGAGAGAAANKVYTDAVSEMLLDRATVQWMTKLPAAASMGQKSIQSHIGRLRDIASKTTNVGLRTAISDYIRTNGFDDLPSL